MSCQTWIDIERSGLGVHASSEHNVSEVFLLFKVISIIDDTVINNLSQKADRRLSSILVYIRHVQVIHEIDENFVGWGTIGLTGSLIYVSLNYLLESFGVSITVEVERSVEDILFVKSREVILNNGSLSSTSRSDIKNSLLSFDVHV